MKGTIIIAEAGVNHNGSLNLAFQLVDAAVEAGVDAVKFQTFRTEHLVTKSAQQAEYQKKNMGQSSSQYEMLKKLELSYEDFRKLKQYCDEKHIMFLSTPFDLESVDFLIQELKLNIIKIPSGEITNAPYLYKIASYGVDVILSTGMATKEEIHHALAFLAYGFAGKMDVSFAAVKHFYQTDEAKMLLGGKVILLHCTTEYPTPYEDVHLNAMDDMREEFHLPVGLSDHTEGIVIPIAAVAKGATIVEKHFTLDKTLPGPDHKASLNPNELKEMVQFIRIVETALGAKRKQPTRTEVKNKGVARKSLVAAQAIRKGEKFTFNNLTVKRPGTGIEPYYYWDYINKIAKRDYEEDEVIE
ncbi:N-acetylneuraminate synthase [Anoxybacillus flavithermus]|uniref:N-acetyl neuramic acid synthetase n=1 Tax=Anoxybacillus flavithermus AK1 TaxID=1297581 RepID=M8D4W4_9BACL|nr:N-acetylneuraminate synthase [Anoxybacillus flavithermus]EMT45876.1 N-acetyl neuramic acid synthetase [Anoxybacillus flavithermus AK1]